MARWTVTDNILPEVNREIKRLSGRVLEGAGMLFKERAIRDCPVSDINTPGYVHLWETIGYEVDTQSTYSQQWVRFYVLKSYAIFVNNGTSRMRARPFFDNGIMAMDRGIDGLIERLYWDLRVGRPPRKL